MFKKLFSKNVNNTSNSQIAIETYLSSMTETQLLDKFVKYQKALNYISREIQRRNNKKIHKIDQCTTIKNMTAYIKPKVTLGKPKVTLGKPNVTLGKPNVTLGKPNVTLSKPTKSNKETKNVESTKGIERSSIRSTKGIERSSRRSKISPKSKKVNPDGSVKIKATVAEMKKTLTLHDVNFDTKMKRADIESLIRKNNLVRLTENSS